MYLLGQLRESGDGGLRLGELRELLVKEYVEEGKAVEKRIREQGETGFMEFDGDRVRLTSKGKVFLRFSDWTSKIYY